MERLDIYDDIPRDMRKYLGENGWHFSKRLFEWATSKMKGRDGSPIQIRSKEAVESQLKADNVTVENGALYDCAYVFNMAVSDFMGSSLKDMKSVSLYVKDYLDDKDGYKGIALTRFFADCIGKGCPIDWESVL